MRQALEADPNADVRCRNPLFEHPPCIVEPPAHDPSGGRLAARRLGELPLERREAASRIVGELPDTQFAPIVVAHKLHEVRPPRRRIVEKQRHEPLFLFEQDEEHLLEL